MPAAASDQPVEGASNIADSPQGGLPWYRALVARARGQGPAAKIIAAVVIVLALGTVAVVLAWFTPQRGVIADMEYPGTETFAFEHLTLGSGYLTLDVEAGLLVPTLSQDDVVGVVVFGLGRADFVPPGDLASELQSVLGVAELHADFEVLYFRIGYQALQQLKALAAATPAQEPEHLSLAQDIIDLLTSDPGLTPMFASPAPRAQGTNPAAVRLYTSGYGRVDYVQGPRIMLELTAPLLRTVSLANPGFAAPAFPELYSQPVLAATILLYAVLAAMMFLLCFALTLHLKEPAWAGRAHNQGGGLPLESLRALDPPYLAARPIYSLLAGYVVIALATAAIFGKNRPLYLAEVAMGAATAYWLYRRRVPFRHLGITGWAQRTSIAAGVLVGFYVVVAGSLSYPSGIRALGLPGWVLAVLRSLLLVAPAREIILRAVAQTGLERYVGRTGAIALPALAGGLAYLGAGLLGFGAAGRQLAPLLMEGLLVVPVTHGLAGYLYARTRNILAPWLVTGLADLLPRVLAF